MPAYKDSSGKWFCKFYYTDQSGAKKQKLKRGFDRKKDAADFEREFLRKQAAAPDMKFRSLAELYLEDVKINKKAVTYRTRESRIRLWILPYFGEMAVNEITPNHVRTWQNELKTATTAAGKPLSPAYLDNIVVQFACVLNFARKYYGLTQNPATLAGNQIGEKTKSLQFWTQTQYESFIATFDKMDPARCLFDMLYFTGCRIGELLAVTPEDIDTDAGTLRINKTFLVIGGKPTVTPPKTKKANRTIILPPFLCEELAAYMARLYGLENDSRIFLQSTSNIDFTFRKHIAAAGLPRIRIHDLRHSHVSLLIDLGFSALLIADRLGHEDVSVTLNTYAHLFPNRQSEIAEKLQKIREK